MKTATLMDLMYAVTHDDRFDNAMMSSDVLLILEIAALKIGVSSLGAPVRLELGNGEVLCVSVEGKTLEPMKFQVQELRPEVLAFSLLMEQRLRDKDEDKGQGWKQKTDIDLTVNVCAAARDIEQSLFPHKGERSIKSLVDMSNHCMMLADALGALEQSA